MSGTPVVTDAIAEEILAKIGSSSLEGALGEIIRELLAQRRHEFRFRHKNAGGLYQACGEGLWIDRRTEGEDMMELAIRERSPGLDLGRQPRPACSLRLGPGSGNSDRRRAR